MFQLNIDQGEVSRYLGFGGNPVDEETSTDIAWAVEELRSVATPRTVSQIFSLQKGEEIALVGTNLVLAGGDITKLLVDCHHCILLAVTLGQGVDNLLRRLQITNLARSVVADVCASSMVEDLCNQLDSQLREEWRGKGKFFTDRFSPGYGDLPLATQHRLCDVLGTQKKLGLAVTGAGIMIPRKSITAVIGIADTKQQMKLRGCAHCDLAPHCSYRKGGTTCFKSF